MPKREQAIPAELQPSPADWSFDLDKALSSVVLLKSVVPEDAFTSGSLGTERGGSAVHIGDGRLLTIGYLVTEAEQLWLTTHDGRILRGDALGYDQATGFGLVQALGRLDIPALKLGRSERTKAGDRAVLAAGGGRKNAMTVKVAARQEFAGYWEYLLEDAIFTAPAHPFWGGAALIGEDGTLLGIGSLVLQQGDEHGQAHDLNMVVPVEHLLPILDDMLRFGRTTAAVRPWLGLYATTDEDTVVVGGLADDGPAEKAGLRTGDQILEVGDRKVTELGDLWRSIWATGEAGAPVRLRLSRDGRETEVTVLSGDRASFLKAPRLH